MKRTGWLRRVGLGMALAFMVASPAWADQYVHGYYRSNGTYVQPYQRSTPDGNPYNNYSFPGNLNPHTGATAPGDPNTYLRNYHDRGGFGGRGFRSFGNADDGE